MTPVPPQAGHLPVPRHFRHLSELITQHLALSCALGAFVARLSISRLLFLDPALQKSPRIQRTRPRQWRRGLGSVDRRVAKMPPRRIKLTDHLISIRFG